MTDVLVCYCFGYTVEDIESDIAKNSRSIIIEKITDAQKMNGCNCAAKNPKGR